MDKYIRVETPEYCPFCVDWSGQMVCAANGTTSSAPECAGYYKNCFDGDCPFLEGSVVVSPKHKQTDRKRGVSIVFGVEQPTDAKADSKAGGRGDSIYTHKRFTIGKAGVVATKVYESEGAMMQDNPGCAVHGVDDEVDIVFKVTQPVDMKEVTDNEW